MAVRVRLMEYFHLTLQDRPGAAYGVLRNLREEGVKLMAFHAYPTGPHTGQMVVFPEDSAVLVRAAETLGLDLGHPQQAFVAEADEAAELLEDVHRPCAAAGINIYATQAMRTEKGCFACLIYVRPADVQPMALVLGLKA